MKVYIATAPTDLRRSFDGLAATAMSVLKRDPSLGGLFVFTNKRGNQVRVLFRDPQGWCVLSKRLDRGRFKRPIIDNELPESEVDMKSLMSFLEDIDLSRSTRQKPKVPAGKLHIIE
jgi:transposase